MTKEEITEIITSLRQSHPEAKCELNYENPFTLLVAVILSAQCTDRRVNEVTDKLFKVYNTPEQFARLTMDELKPYIFSCGFYNNKGKNIINMSKRLMSDYGGEVPRDFEKLVKLDGVGRKTASVVSAVAFNIPSMPVDTHVFRVSKRIGFSDGKTPFDVEQDLKNVIPKEEWNIFHHYMIFHGRYVCHSRKPDCEKCLLTKNCKYFKESK